MSWSDNLVFKPFIGDFSPSPFCTTRKISPSVSPCAHVSSVRLGGCESFGASGPSPLASAPWQKEQYFLNEAAPAVTEAAVAATGFFIFFGSGPTPEVCPSTVIANATENVKRAPLIRTDARLMIGTPTNLRIWLKRYRNAKLLNFIKDRGCLLSYEGQPRCVYATGSAGAGRGLGVDVLPQPVVDELDHLVAVPIEEHLVHVAVDADVLEPHEIVLGPGLIQPLRDTRVEHAVIRA